MMDEGYVSRAFRLVDWKPPEQRRAVRGAMGDVMGESVWRSRFHLLETGRHHLAVAAVAAPAKDDGDASKAAVSLVLSMGRSDDLSCPNGVDMDPSAGDEGVCKLNSLFDPLLLEKRSVSSSRRKI